MIISSKALQDSMGAAARRRAEDLGWDQVAGQMMDIYREESRVARSDVLER
jgi:glycosyltransferase involved in cell wall biosynthesis